MVAPISGVNGLFDMDTPFWGVNSYTGVKCSTNTICGVTLTLFSGVNLQLSPILMVSST